MSPGPRREAAASVRWWTVQSAWYSLRAGGCPHSPGEPPARPRDGGLTRRWRSTASNCREGAAVDRPCVPGCRSACTYSPSAGTVITAPPLPRRCPRSRASRCCASVSPCCVRLGRRCGGSGGAAAVTRATHTTTSNTARPGQHAGDCVPTASGVDDAHRVWSSLCSACRYLPCPAHHGRAEGSWVLQTRREDSFDGGRVAFRFGRVCLWSAFEPTPRCPLSYSAIGCVCLET